MDEKETLKKMEILAYPILMVPFHGTPVPVMVRELTQAQTMACGSFSLIETFRDRLENKANIKKITLPNLVKYSTLSHNIVEKALVKPTYDEIIKIISKKDREKIIAELDGMELKLIDTPKGLKQTELKSEIAALKIWANLLLPEDFTSWIVSYTLGVDKSDIKDITEEILLNAAILAEKGRDNPADHISGRFTGFMKDDINVRAWVLLQEKRAMESNRNGR